MTETLDDFGLHLWQPGDPAPPADAAADALQINGDWYTVVARTAHGPFPTFRDALLAIGRDGLGRLTCSAFGCDAAADLALEAPGLVTFCREHFDPDDWPELNVVAIEDLDVLDLAEPPPMGRDPFAGMGDLLATDGERRQPDPRDPLLVTWEAAPEGSPIPGGYVARIQSGPRKTIGYGAYGSVAALIGDVITRGLGTIQCPRCVGSSATRAVFHDPTTNDRNPTLCCGDCVDAIAGASSTVVDLTTLGVAHE